MCCSSNYGHKKPSTCFLFFLPITSLHIESKTQTIPAYNQICHLFVKSIGMLSFFAVENIILHSYHSSFNVTILAVIAVTTTLCSCYQGHGSFFLMGIHVSIYNHRRHWWQRTSLMMAQTDRTTEPQTRTSEERTFD